MPLIQTPSIASVVEDQTPQLGGSLSTNGSNINVESGDVLYVHNIGTEGDANYERLEIKWDANVAKIQTVKAGTGSNDALELIGSNSLLFVGTTLASFVNASLTMTQSDTLTETYNDFVPATDSTYDNGSTSARWATTYTNGIATDVETFTAASDTLDALNNVCLCDCTSNAITLALPVPVAGLQFHIKKIDATANTVNIEPDDPGPELIDGAIVYTLSTQYNSVTVVSDGSNWFII